jgi:dihydroxyacetone kinase-like predicted kinase
MWGAATGDERHANLNADNHPLSASEGNRASISATESAKHAVFTLDRLNVWPVRDTNTGIN